MFVEEGWGGGEVGKEGRGRERKEGREKGRREEMGVKVVYQERPRREPKIHSCW